MDEFREQAMRFGTEIINVWIDRVDLFGSGRSRFTERRARTATRSRSHKGEIADDLDGRFAKWPAFRARPLCPEGLGGNGVSACATCDWILLPATSR